MTDLDRLLAWFESGRLVRPSADELNFCDLVRALSALTGAGGGVGQGRGARRLSDLIGPAEHYVLVLVDGLGCELLQAAPAAGFLRTRQAERLQAVFPSTTAAALTTLATGRWPAGHAVVAWWLCLEEAGLSATALPFVERFSERPLGEFGVRPDDVYPVASFWPRMRHEPLTLTKAGLEETAYSRYAAGGTARVGCGTLDEGFQAVHRRVMGAERPSFTYLYLPQVDALCHREGTASDGMAPLLADLDARLGAMCEALDGRARLIVTADHGEVDTPPDRRFVLDAASPLLDALVCPPTGEPTVPILHARPGRQERACELLADRTDGAFALLTADQVEALRLLGPEPLAETTRQRLGDLMGIAGEPTALYTAGPNGQVRVHVGVHAGLTPSEMWVPLILA